MAIQWGLLSDAGRSINDLGGFIGGELKDRRAKREFQELIASLPQAQQQPTLASLSSYAATGAASPSPLPQQSPSLAQLSQSGEVPALGIARGQIPAMARAQSPGDAFAGEMAQKWSGPQVGGAVPAMASAPSPFLAQRPVQQAQSVNIPQSLIQSESGGRFNAQNNAVGAGGMRGHFGRLQFGQARLQEAAAAGAIPQGTTPQQFMASPELQQRAEQWHFADIDNFIKQNGLDRLVGQSVNGVPITVDGMRAVAHLGGKQGLARFIQTGGQYNPADANGTTLMAYLARHGGQSQAQTNPLAGVAPLNAGSAPQAQQQPITLAQLSQSSQPVIPPELLGRLATNPYGQQIANTLIQRQFADPVQRQLQQLQLQQGQLGVEKARRELAGDSQRLTYQDLGDSIGVLNARGEIVRQIPKSQRPVALSEGQSLVDPNTGRVLAGGVQRAGGTEFRKTLDKKNAEMFSDLLGQKAQIESDLADVNQLRGLVSQIPTGFLGRNAARGATAIGVQTASGASLQQFDAIVSRLVPSQRQPGSGTMSDRDVELFRASLPSLAGTPEGNKRIIDTMEGMARYKQQQTLIAEAVATGQISPQDGIKALSQIKNPLEWVRENKGQQSQQPSAKPTGRTSGGVEWRVE